MVLIHAKADAGRCFLGNSVKSRIFIGYAAIFLVTLVAAVLLIQSNRQLMQQVGGFVDRSVPALQAVSALQNTIGQQVLAGYELYGTVIKSSEFSEKQQRMEQALQRHLQTLDKIGGNSLQQGQQKLQQALQQLLQVMQTAPVDWDQARIELSVVNQTATELNQQLETLAASITQDAQASTKNISGALSQNSSTVVVLLLLIVLVAVGFFLLAQKQIAHPIIRLSSDLQQVADSRDLTRHLRTDTVAEVNSVAASINQLLGVFKSGIADIYQAISGINQAVDALAGSSAQSSSAVQQLEKTISVLVNSMAQLEQHMEDSVSRSMHAATAAQAGATAMSQSQVEVQQTADSIRQLSGDIENTGQMLLTLQATGTEVSGVVKTIADIASQTNLLALNAAIEAARAGESGRGFAVVADEVRTLAVRTQQSTAEINNMLAKIVSSIQAAVANMQSNRETAQHSVELACQLVQTLENGRQVILTLADVSQEAADLANHSQQKASKLKHEILAFEQNGQSVSAANQAVASTSQALTGLAGQLRKTAALFKH
jgi:methyl-accepting chemotaxis protein